MSGNNFKLIEIDQDEFGASLDGFYGTYADLMKVIISMSAKIPEEYRESATWSIDVCEYYGVPRVEVCIIYKRPFTPQEIAEINEKKIKSDAIQKAKDIKTIAALRSKWNV